MRGSIYPSFGVSALLKQGRQKGNACRRYTDLSPHLPDPPHEIQPGLTVVSYAFRNSKGRIMHTLPHFEQAFQSVGWFIPPYVQMGVLSRLAVYYGLLCDIRAHKPTA